MQCLKCKTDSAHRSHRHGAVEMLASLVAVYPYRCRNCSHRFLKFRYGAPDTERNREIVASRKSLAWKRKRREFLLYAAGMLLFAVFLYFLTREHGGTADSG